MMMSVQRQVLSLLRNAKRLRLRNLIVSYSRRCGRICIDVACTCLFDTDDIFYEHQDELHTGADSDEAFGRWPQTTHYVYDVAAERTLQRIGRGRVRMLVDGVH